MKKNNITVFWGCTINDRLPFIERTTRVVLESLNYNVVDPVGITCCPDPVYARGLGEDKWLLLAGRNLALCKRLADKLLIPCNGCFATFTKASNQLKDKKVRDNINAHLKTFGLKYEKSPELIHILQFFNKIGSKELQKSFLFQLSGMRVGVHYGCHILNSELTAIDNMFAPEIFEEILSSTGLEVVDYEDKPLCCGGSTFPFDPEGSIGLLRQKFKSAKKAGIDAIILCCPLCFVQFDMQSKKLNKEEVLPVFYISEILALALGISEKDLNFDWHVVKPETLLEQKLLKKIREENIIMEFDIERLSKCCGACTYECSSAKGLQDNDYLRFDPVSIVKRIVEGKVEEVLRDLAIMRCLRCQECTKRCPFGDGLPEFFEKLQNLAIKTGIQAKPIEQKLNLILSTGMGIPRNVAIRKDFGLPTINIIAKTELEKLLKKG